MDPVEAVSFLREKRRGAINEKQLLYLSGEYKKMYKKKSAAGGGGGGCCTILWTTIVAAKITTTTTTNEEGDQRTANVSSSISKRQRQNIFTLMEEKRRRRRREIIRIVMCLLCVDRNLLVRSLFFFLFLEFLMRGYAGVWVPVFVFVLWTSLCCVRRAVRNQLSWLLQLARPDSQILPYIPRNNNGL